MGLRDHLIVAGHKHIGGSEQFVTPDGLVCQIVRVAGYKVVDEYAKQLALKKMMIHQAALILIDPREPETSAGRCWCAPTVEKGVVFLNALRSSYEQGKKRRSVK
jgi:AmiR/NasT family two-component response regulator